MLRVIALCASFVVIGAEASSGEGDKQMSGMSIVGNDEAKLPVLVISTAEAAEGATAMEFQIGLSAPAKRSIFVVYGTFDRTAKAGEDYRTERGSLELAAGDSSAVLSIPLIDDDVAEGDETFEVFVDGELATCEPAADLPLTQRYMLR